ncbi:MAG: protein-L-isoaspartate(D-aspartate) O-methyltransferase [Thermoanaerobaculia bacterium]
MRDRVCNFRRLKSALTALLALCYFSGMPAAAADDPGDLQNTRRQQMVELVRGRGVSDRRVLDAMGMVPRHLFVPEKVRPQAYEDFPLPIGSQQTISQPYIVALMSSLLELKGGEKVLEIGTGSGYQAAVLSKIAGEVYTIEILGPLSDSAQKAISSLGYDNIHFRVGDGYAGWPEAAPFDGIVVTAAPEKVPQPLIDQLKVGGKLVIPVGSFFQDLLVLTKTANGGVERKNVIPVRFVPMTGEAQKPPAPSAPPVAPPSQRH